MEERMPFEFNVAASQHPELKTKQPWGNPEILFVDSGRLYTYASARRVDVAKVARFDIDYLDRIPSLRAELRASHEGSLEAKDEKAKKSLKAEREKSDLLLGALLTGARYVFRNDEDAMKQIDRIGSTGALYDRVADLHRAADFCEAHPELLTADPRIPTDFVAQTREVAEKLVSVPDYSASREMLDRRNLAFWLLDEAVNEVRAAVRFGFPNDPSFIEKACTPYVPPRKRKAKSEKGEKSDSLLGSESGE
jgi:hypothetical protein